MKLHRIRSEAMLGGVCAGLAHYFNIDVTIVRLIFILLVVLPGIGVLLYFILWFLLPSEEDAASDWGYTADEIGMRGRRFGREVSDVFVKRRENTIRLAGIALILLGLVALVRIFIPGVFFWIDRISGPLVLILIGGTLLFLALRGGKK
jgi:phage shock protein C